MAFLRSRLLWIAAAVVLIAALLPFWLSAYLLGILTAAYYFGVFAMAWDLLFGFAGEVNFGPTFLIGLGAYTAAILNSTFGLPIPVCVIAAALAAVAGGILLAVPALRLRGPYFGLVTLVAVLLLQNFVVIFASVTGGEIGMTVPDVLSIDASVNYWYALAFLVLCAVLLFGLSRSAVGLILQASGQDAVGASALGFNVTKHKVAAFCVSALFSGTAGAMLIFYMGTASVDTVVDVAIAVQIIIAAVLGGRRTILGAALGAVFLIVANEFLRPLGQLNTFVVAADRARRHPVLPRRAARLRTAPRANANERRGPPAGQRPRQALRRRRRRQEYEFRPSRRRNRRADRSERLRQVYRDVADHGHRARQFRRDQARRRRHRRLAGAPHRALRREHRLPAFAAACSVRPCWKTSSWRFCPTRFCGSRPKPRPPSAHAPSPNASGWATCCTGIHGRCHSPIFAAWNWPKAVARDPKVVLIDEPFAGLTAAEIKVFSDLIRTLRDEGRAVLLVDHSVKSVAALADRVIAMYLGERIAEGSADEVMQNETVRRVYIGGKIENVERKSVSRGARRHPARYRRRRSVLRQGQCARPRLLARSTG